MTLHEAFKEVICSPLLRRKAVDSFKPKPERRHNIITRLSNHNIALRGGIYPSDKTMRDVVKRAGGKLESIETWTI